MKNNHSFRLPLKRMSGFLLTAGILLSTPTFSDSICKAPGSDDNLKRAATYLAQNQTKDGVITTKTGLQYLITKEGDGITTPTARSEVVAHYELFNLEGKKLESSRDRGIPLQFKVTRVIKGWTEALLTMSVGEKRTLTIPADLAYGCKGARPKIGSNELLIFEMELVHVVNNRK